MDRVIVQPGALPQDTDVLNTNIFALINDGFKNQALLGSNTVVAGLTVTPSTPTANLNVNVAAGSIFQVDPIDASAYGSLGTNANSIVKQGISSSPLVLAITPPSTAGFSQVYLVEAILNDVDSGSMVLSYYNSANPAQPFSGPSNSGSSNYTIRQCKCAIALKAGVAATTGTQVAPTVDSGYVPLFYVTVANGQTQITSTNIAQVPAAPYFPTLPQVPYQVQQGTYVYGGQDTGAANAYVVTFAAGQPIPASYTVGMGVKFKALNACSGASTINVNGLGLVSIRRASGTALTTGDIVSGQVVELTYDGTYFQMQNYMGAGAGTNTTTAVSIPYVADTGTQNAIIATYSPAITSGQQVAGLALEVKLANTITGACTINVNGLGAKSVMTGDLQNPPNSVFVAGEVLLLIYDGTQYQIANTSSLTYRKPSTNLTIYVNTSSGSDTLYDGTSASVGSGTAGPLKTISKAVLVAFGYAPSQFTITIQVAAGTYNETVSTPMFAGPSLAINGASAGSVTVNGGNGNAFFIQGLNTVTVTNITAITNSVVNATAFEAYGSGAILITSGCVSGNCTWHFIAEAGGQVQPGNHTFSGSASAMYLTLFNGVINIPSGVTHTISTPISVTVCAEAGGGASIIVNNEPGYPPVVYVNPSYVSGPKYFASSNGTINTSGLGVNFLPGSSAGSTATGGQYT